MKSKYRLPLLLLLLTTFLYFYTTRPPPTPPDWSLGLPQNLLKKFLSKKLSSTDQPLIFTISDKDYLSQQINFQEKFLPWGRNYDFFVICLDKECFEEKDGIKKFDGSELMPFGRGGWERGEVMLNTAKILSSLDYSFVYIDIESVVTGSIDPFDSMAKLEDGEWDIQFMQQSGTIDPGWFFVKSTDNSKGYFERCWERVLVMRGVGGRDHAENSGGRELKARDVAGDKKKGKGRDEVVIKIMKRLLKEMPVVAKLLDARFFKSWSDFNNWETDHISSERKLQELLHTTSIIHLTCVEPSLRLYFSKFLGGWSDFNAYYSNPQGKYLTITGITGRSDQLINLLSLAIRISIDTGRILILPYTVDILLKRSITDEKGISKPEFVRNPDFPIYRLIDISSLNSIDFTYVEASFRIHRTSYSASKLYSSTVELNDDLLEYEYGLKAPKLFMKVRELDDRQVVTISLEGAKMREWQMGKKFDYIKGVRSRIRACGNVDEEGWKCEGRCL